MNYYHIFENKLKIIHSPIKEVDLTLIWVGVVLFPPVRWFSLNNSKTVKAVTLEF